MPARPLSRLPRAITASLAAGALTLAATTSAGAAPYNVETSRHCDCGARVGSAPPAQLATRATGVVARGETAPTAEPAPGQPTWPLYPRPLHSTSSQQVASSVGDDFHWDDAGIGAAGALGVMLAGLGGALVLRRRHALGSTTPA